jgi:type II secretory pathway component GspD/PulD (secretin)
MAKRCMVLIIFVGLFALTGGGHAQVGSAAKNQRIVYMVKNGEAKDLANILGKHFKGDAEVQVLPDSPSNCLLISAAPSVFEEVVKTLEKLDKRPQLVSVELLIAEVTPKKGDDGKSAARELDDKEFTGTTKEVVEKLEALKKDGVIGSLDRIQLTAVEEEPASVQLGGNTPIVTGVTVTATGHVSKRITFVNTGTSASVRVRVLAENVVAMELNIRDSRAHVPEDGIELGKDEKGASLRATEILTATLKSRVNVRSEHAVVAEGIKTESKSGQARTLIVVAPRILDPGAKGSK